MIGLLRRVGPLGASIAAAQTALTLHRHWQSIPRRDRERLQELLRKSKGRRSNLSRAERRELRRLLTALQLPRLLRQGTIDAAVLRRQLRPPS